MKQQREKTLDEQRRIVAYLDNLQAKVNALRGFSSPSLHFGDATQSASGEELRPFFGPLRALTLSPMAASGMPSILDKAFKGEL